MYGPRKKKNIFEIFLIKLLQLRQRLNKFKKRNNVKTQKRENDDPKAIYEDTVVPIIKTQLTLLGFEIFNPNYKVSLVFGLVIFDAISYTILNFVDVILIWGSTFENVCFCLVTWMLGFTAFMLIYAVLTNRTLYSDILKLIYGFGNSLHKTDDWQEIEKYKKHSLICKKLIYMTIFFCTGGGIICTFYPIIIYFVTGKSVLPYGFFIPGLSVETNPGYLINYAYQIIQCFLTVLGTMQTTFHTLIFFTSNAFFQIDNLIIKIRKLNISIEKNPNNC